MPFLQRLCCLCQVESKGSVRHTHTHTLPVYRLRKEKERQGEIERVRERAKNRSVREQMCVASALIWKTEESEYEESHVTRNGMILLGRVTAMGTKKGKGKKNKKGTLDNQAEFSDDHNRRTRRHINRDAFVSTRTCISTCNTSGHATHAHTNVEDVSSFTKLTRVPRD